MLYPYSDEEVLLLGVQASEESNQNPRYAILNGARRKLKITDRVLHYTPFDPALNLEA